MERVSRRENIQEEVQPETQEVTQPPATPLPPPETPKPKNWLIVGLIALIFVPLGVAGLLAYQNWQARQKVFQSEQIATPLELPSCQTDADCPQPMCIPGEVVCSLEKCFLCAPYQCRNRQCAPNYSVAIANWKTYQGDTFEFKYPQNWALQETPLKLTDPANRLVISIASFDPAVVGISYCQAFFEDSSRCERFKTREGREVIIDWGEEGSSVAGTTISDGASLSVNLYTNPDTPVRLMLTSEDRDLFQTFLSTFKFIDQKGFTCPEVKILNCMPGGIDPESAKYCASEYSAWIRKNCPEVKMAY